MKIVTEVLVAGRFFRRAGRPARGQGFLEDAGRDWEGADGSLARAGGWSHRGSVLSPGGRPARGQFFLGRGLGIGRVLPPSGLGEHGSRAGR